MAFLTPFGHFKCQNLNMKLTPGLKRQLEEGGKTRMAKESFLRDTERIWNHALISIKLSKTFMGAKQEIKKYFKTLPI